MAPTPGFQRRTANNPRVTTMRDRFNDHFSANPENYKKYRPDYPRELFLYLAGLAPHRERAWDCATGSGQAAKRLAGLFKQVIASDPSPAQITQAESIHGVKYTVATAENSGLGNAAVDLITVAQALHWFRISDFFKEADRVLKPDGILAVWSYNLLTLTPEMDDIIFHFYENTLDEHWPPERILVERGYQGIDFPFQPITPPAFEMRTQWTLPALIGYLSTWSAVRRFQSTHAVSPIPDVYEKISRHWGDPLQPRPVTWPLTLIIRKKTD